MKRTDLEVIKAPFVTNTNEKTFNKEASFALQLIGSSKGLQQCSKDSLLRAVLNISQTGLTLNPALKLAYLVPRWSPNGSQACLEPSYQGLIKLITDTGSVENVTARVVYDCDEFDITYGLADNITHKPNPFEKDKKVIGVYAVATFPTGNKQVEFMSIHDVNEIMHMSESYKAYEAKKIKSCVWVDHFDEMARKTVIRRLVKYLPKSERWEKVAQAIELDESDFKPSSSRIHYAEQLVERLPMEYQDDLFRELEYCNASRCEEIINFALQNQPNSLESGRTVSMSEINQQVKAKLDDENS